MSIEKIYRLALRSDLTMSVTVNIGWTLSIWLKHPAEVDEQTYIDGSVFLSLSESTNIHVGSEQNFGSLFDFLNAPKEFALTGEGLLRDTIYSEECVSSGLKQPLGDLIVFKISRPNEPVFKIEIEISEKLCSTLDEVKTKILEDIRLMFSKEYLDFVRHIALDEDEFQLSN